MALNYLLNPSREISSLTSNIDGIKLFISKTLRRDDPLYAFYSQMIQQITPNSQGSTRQIVHTLEQFAILIANNCKVELYDTSYPQLVGLMVQLMEKNDNYMIQTEECDMMFINECLEYARNLGTIEKLIPYKLLFAIKLFDFGKCDQALRYCEIIKTEQFRGKLNWPLIIKIINEIESRCGIVDIQEDVTLMNYNENSFNQFQVDGNERINEKTDDSTETSPKHVANEIEHLNGFSKQTSFDENDKGDDINDNFENLNLNSESFPKKPVQSVPLMPNNNLPQAQMGSSKTSWRRHRNSSVNSQTSDKSNAPTLPPHFIPATNQNFENNFFMPSTQINPEEPLSFVSTGIVDIKSIPNPYINEEESYGKEVSNDSYITSQSTSEQTVSSDVQSNDSIDLKENKESQAQPSQQKPQQQSSSLLGGFLSKFVPKGPKQAILPDDTKKSIVYNKELGQWVDTNADPKEMQQQQQIANGPPRIPLMSTAQPPNPQGVSPGLPVPPGFPVPPVQDFKFRPNVGKKPTRYVDYLHKDTKA